MRIGYEAIRMFISYPHVHKLSACSLPIHIRGQQAQPRPFTEAINAGVAPSPTGMAASSTGVTGSAGQVDTWAPSLRRLTPQVVVQAGRPHCHLSGPAAQERITTTSKRAHRPTRAQSGARAQNHGVNVQTLPTRRREQMPPPSIPTFPHQKAKKSRHQQHAASYNPDMTAYCGLEELGLVAVGMRCGSSGVCRGLLRCPISHRCPISRRCPISHHCPTSVIS